MRILCVYGNPPPVTGSTIGTLLTSVLKAMIFVWATCLAGIAKSPPWPPDLAIQREWLAETKTDASPTMSISAPVYVRRK